MPASETNSSDFFLEISIISPTLLFPSIVYPGFTALINKSELINSDSSAKTFFKLKNVKTAARINRPKIIKTFFMPKT